MDNKDKAAQTQNAGAARQGGITSIEGLTRWAPSTRYPGSMVEDELSGFVKFADVSALASQSQAAQPTVKTWQERLNAVDPTIRVKTEGAAKDAEIAELRAHIAGTSQATKAQAEPDSRQLSEVITHAIAAHKKGLEVSQVFAVSPTDANGWLSRFIMDAIEHYRPDVSDVAPVAKEAPAVLTDEAIDEVWSAMPGGTDGWLKQFGYRQFARSIARHVLVRVAASMAGTIRPTDDELWEQTIGERDNHQEWADKLAAAIAKHFDAEIGEHSNMNCPWAEALEVIECAAPVASVAKEATRDQDEQQAARDRSDAVRYRFLIEKADVLPPFAAPAGQHDAAVKLLLSALTRCRFDDSISGRSKIANDAVEALAKLEQSSTAGSAKGGITNESGSDIATTTSTVSAPNVQNPYHGYLSHYWQAGYDGDKIDATLRGAALGAYGRGVKDRTEGAQKAPEEVRYAEYYRHIRNLTVEQAGAPGQPSIALPNGMNSGYYITEETADHAIEESIKEHALRTSSTDQANADTGSAA